MNIKKTWKNNYNSDDILKNKNVNIENDNLPIEIKKILFLRNLLHL